MDGAVKSNKSKNYNPVNTSSLARNLPPQKGGTRVVFAEKRGI